MFTSFFKMIKNYNFKVFKDDLSAGLSVASVALPQSMAYALIAGVNPIYGLYTSIVAMITATFVGVSNYMIAGPTNMMSLAIASNLTSLEEVSYLEGVLLLTFLVGVIQVLLGMLRLGDLVTYVSHPVITGLTFGVALIIGIGQLDNLLGLEIEMGANIFSTFYNIIINLEQTNLYSFLIGALTIAIIAIIKKSNLGLPSYLVGVIISICIVYIFNLRESLAVVGNFTASLPEFRPIKLNFNLVQQLFSSALSIAILGFIQVISIVKSLEKKSEQQVKLNQEFIGQGLINICCSLFSGFVISGSFTKSFINYSAGAKTRISQLITGLSFILVILLFNPVVRYIPISSLAALVIVVACSMIERKEIVQSFKTTTADAIMFSVTFITTILAPRLDYAIYVGVIVSIIILLKNASGVQYSHMSYGQQGKGDFSNQEQLTNIKEDDYILINLAGNLQFNSAENLKDKLNQSFTENKAFVIRTRYLDHIDITSIQELEKFIDKVYDHGGKVLLCGVDEELLKALQQAGTLDKVNKENVFLADQQIFSSTKQAIKKVASGNSI
ncbi:SulP family inorganic anion transporter [Natroniella sulfidigena]|uniref:SulP family inorganic anion transporter n=1 Tax=Natroniella sulfidigena TaxID=723921 RepID=UPI00200AC2C6|nr:SulP family inorganic anion transporter [Natroniella sulfidigena]MCK8817923.1 SulP family inorganic anion transporter [Natroniella sulfidigena]